MSDGGRDLDREQLLGLLRELGSELDGQGLTATIYVVGGTAMTLTFDRRRTTRDVDAYTRDHQQELRAAADIVAARHGLSPNWINSAAVAFFSSEPDASPGELSFPGLHVTVASPEHLLAMKLRASRGKDYQDLELLFNLLDITDPQQAADITNRLFDDSSIGWQGADEAYFLAQDVFERARRAGRRIGGDQVPPDSLNVLTELGGSWSDVARARRASAPPPPAPPDPGV